MKKHANKAFRRVAALIMSVILLATSLPIAFAAGDYDPTPTFSEDSTLWAWMTDDGGVQVIFPEATPVKTYISDKHIETYYITLYDLGPFTEVHNDPATEEVPSVRIALNAEAQTFSADGTGTMTFTAKKLAENGITLNETDRFSVEVLAQDSTGWVSEPISTIVSDVPQFVYDAESYNPLTEEPQAIREMMLFEAKNNDGTGFVSDNGTGGGRLDYVQDGNQLEFVGRTAQAGVENASGVDSYAYGFRVLGTGAQSFSTTYSRQHWIASGAEEVWFWFDLSEVSVQDLAFELKTQGKRYGEQYYYNWFSPQGTPEYLYSSENDDNYSAVTYSTKGYTGDDGYVFIQNDDGSWKKVSLVNGGISLSNYEGYIRVPIDFICSTSDTYVEARNDNFGTAGTNWDGDRGESFVNNNVLFSSPVLVDPAGTPISDALLLQYRLMNFSNNSVNGSYTTRAGNNGWGYTMLAVGPDKSDCGTNQDGTKAYVDENGVIQNRENGYHALDDIFGAGFSYTSMSADSVRRSFFLDSVLFCRTDGGTYPADMSEQDGGTPVANYYDQTVEIPRSILNQIEELITTPDLGDFRAVQYIDELLDGYRKAYSDAGMSTDFLSEENMATVAASTGMSDVWQNFLDARTACINGGTIKDNGDGTYTYLPNNSAYDLVPELIQSLEKLPDPSQVTSVSDTLRNEVVRLWQLYRQLNLTQLDAMSFEEEQKILNYASLVRAAGGDEMLVGTSLATNKFLSFNDFESLPEGTHAYDLQDSPSWDQGKDYRYSKGFVYGSMSFRDFAAHSTAAVGDWMGDVSQDSYQNGLYDALNLAAANTVIAEEVGAGGSKGAQVTIDSRFFSGSEGNPSGYVNAVSVTRDFNSTETGDYHNLQSIADWKLSRYAESWSASDGRDYPVGLVFYVDFSELKDIDFLLSVNIATSYDGHAEGYNLDMDMSGSEQAYKIMDMETGEWVTITGTGSPYGFTSKGGSSSIGTLADGYKGYIYVALNKFELSTAMGTVDLCAMGEQIDNIRRVEVGVMPLNSTAAAQMDGRSFVVDDIGFAYGADSYDAGTVAELNHPSFEEVKGYKSTAAKAFEDAVAIIEAGDQANFAQRVSEARTLYNALTDYQKNNTTSVKQAYAQLEFYEKIIRGEISAIEYQPVHGTDAFAAFVASLSEGLKNASVTGENDLPYPGVKDTNGDGRADTVNYEKFDGLTKELAAQIIEYYDNSYSRYTKEQKAALGETATQFLNAYNAASRCYNTLEHILDEGDTFLNELFTEDASTSLFRTMSDIYPAKADADGLGTAGDKQVYAYDKNTPYGDRVTAEGATVDEGYFVTLKDRTALNHISETYRNLTDYYAKYLLAQGDLQAGVKNIPMAVRKLIYNSDTYTNAKGETVYGGIRTLYYRYQDLYNAAKAKVNAGTALSEDELAALRLATEEYEMLLPTYHDVAELYDLIQQIYDLFPAIKSTFTATGDPSSVTNRTMILAYDGTSATVENTADPIYTLTQFEQYLTDANGQGTLTITSKNGGLLKSEDGTQTLAYTLTYDGTEANLADGTTVGSYDAPMTAGIPLHVTIDTPQTFPVVLSDTVTLTFTYQYTDRHGILREVTDQKTLSILYTTDDMYTVTIPAEVEIPWGSESVPTEYHNGTGYIVTCNLNEGSSLSVQAALASTDFALTTAGTSESIACTGSNSAAGNFTGKQVEAQGAGPSISIAASEWQMIPVAAYRANDQITYTVQYTDGSATP